MDITQIYNNFLNSWHGQKVDYDHVDGFECVDLIKQYLHQDFGLAPGSWGNAVQYWYLTAAPILTKFNKVGGTTVQIGDIVVLGFDHIGIANGVQSATTFEQLDQNGGKGTGTGTGVDAIQVHTFQKKDIIGILRPIGATLGPPYTITPMDPRHLHVKPNERKWNLALQNLAAVVAAPAGNSGAGYNFTAVATLKHHDPSLSNYTYYLENANVPQGWNELDCVQGAPSTPTPAIGLASPSAAPIPFPGDTTPYNVVVNVPGYSTSNDAANHINRKITVPKGSDYYVYNKRYDAHGKLIAINVTKQVGKSYAWINPEDNQVKPYTPPPVPAPKPKTPAESTSATLAAAAASLSTPAKPVVPPANVTDNTWKKTLTPLLSTGKPIHFRILRDVYVHDMNDGGDAGIELHESNPDDKNTWLPIKYWMTRSNMLYLVPFLAADLDANGKPKPNAHYYAIPTSDIDTGLPCLESELSNIPVESARQYRKDQGRSTASDDLFYAGQRIAKMVADGVRFMDGIIPIKVSLKTKNRSTK